MRLLPTPSRLLQCRYGLILPPNYDQQPQRRYPVIVLLHGGHDDGRAFVDQYAITETLDPLYSCVLAPSIIMPPDGNDASFLRSSQQFHATLDRLGVVNTLEVFPGGHGLSGPAVGWNDIRKHLSDSLAFVGRSFAANDRQAAGAGQP